MKPPQISARECINALAKIGFQVQRQSGSHIILVRDEPKTIIPIPNDNPIAFGTLRSILRQAGLSVEEFIILLRK